MGNLIGPHEGQELELMLAGSKNLALFEQGLMPDGFSEPVEAGIFGVLKFYPLPNVGYYGLIVYVQGSLEKAERLRDLIVSSVGKGFQEHIEREIGKLLGYSDAAVDAYVEKMKNKRK